MKKDVIYIDLEDDITSIIEKVKSSSEKIIALVPPKRTGVLQSAVNLKLLHKAATGVDKRLVLITGDKSLAALAAGVQIPVAKTLQSRPELATATPPPDDEGEDVINGEEIPVGEFARQAAGPPKTPDDEEIELPPDLGKEADKPKEALGSAKKPKKTGPAIPNFDRFRKKFLLIGVGGVLLLIILIWLIVFAPHATVNISARTTEVPVDFATTLNPAGTTNADQNVIRPATGQIKKTNSLDFDATGKKDVGEKATGVVTLSNCADDQPITVPAGTAVSSNGLNFITASSASVPGGKSSIKFGPCTQPGTTTVSVTAQDIGDQYNIGSGNVFTVANQPSGMSGSNKSAFTGGSKRQITVISDADVASAKQKLATQDQDAIKQQLTSQFDAKKQIVMSDSFNVSSGDPSLSPAVGTEASKGHITQEITYTLQALNKSDVSKIIKAYVQKNTIKSEKDQQVYDDGVDHLKLSKFTANPTGSSIQLTTTTQVGPKIDASSLKPQLVNKNYEDIRQTVQKIDGVDDVDTKFTPFWVSSISDQKKISIKFSVSKK